MSCDTSFKPPFFVPTTRAFNQIVNGTSMVQCPHCSAAITCDPDNTTYTLKDDPPGGFWR